MSSLLSFGLACLGGFALGLAYFASLWLALQRLPTARHPVALAMGSLLGRVALAVVGFYLIGAGDWRRFLLALVGFAFARLLLVRRWGEPGRSQRPAEGDAAT
jgi:F1F0 ATPase subunit 2